MKDKPLHSSPLQPAPKRGTDETYPDDHHSITSYNLTFTSLSIILLSFFIFLNSVAVPDVVREKQVLGSLAEQFVQDNTHSALPSAEQTRDTASEAQRFKAAVKFPSMSLTNFFSSRPGQALLGDARLQKQLDHFAISIPADKVFSLDDDQIQARFLPIFEALAHQLEKDSLYLKIESHTDGVRISTARFHSNWNFSIARALSIYRFFLDQGMSQANISARGYAGYQPVFSNDTAAGRRKNNRIVLIIGYPRHELNEAA